MANQLLIDSGLFKYATEDVAMTRLNLPDIISLAKHPKALMTRYDIFATMLKSRLFSLQSMFGQFQTITICVDRKSWRTVITPLAIPGTEQSSGIGYKASRDTTDAEELEARGILNKQYLRCVEFVRGNNNINVLVHDGLEADDIMVIKSKQFADNGDIAVVFSADRDNTQACYNNQETGGHVFVAVPGPNGSYRRIVCNHATASLMGYTDMFKAPPFPITLINAFKQVGEIVAPAYLLLEKILRGDSDDIAPLMCKFSESGRRSMFPPSKLFDLGYYIGQLRGRTYMTYEDLYDDELIYEIIDACHVGVFKHGLDDIIDVEAQKVYDALPEQAQDLQYEELQEMHAKARKTWIDFYTAKFKENRQLICCNPYELKHYWQSCEQLQIHADKMPMIDIPNSQALQMLGIDL